MSDLVAITRDELTAIIEEASLKAVAASGRKSWFTLSDAAIYTGYSESCLRRLAVDQRRISFTRPTGPRGDLRFSLSALDDFLSGKTQPKRPGRKRKSKIVVI